MGVTAADDNMSPTPWEPAPAAQPDIFFTLPPELRDMIYDLVYGDTRRVTIRTIRKQWEEDEEIRQLRERETFVPGDDFPDSALSGLIVNKQYFDEACRVWLRSKTFCFPGWSACDEFVHSENPIHRFLSSFITAVESVSLTGSSYSRFQYMPALRSFSMQLDPQGFTNTVRSKKIPWLDDYSDIDLANIPDIEGPLRLRGLQKLEISWEKDYFKLTTPQHHVQWARLRAQAETLIHNVATLPRETKQGRGNPLTIEDALKARRASNKSFGRVFALGPNTKVAALTDDDMPLTEDQLLHLCLSKPKAFLKWIEDAVKERKEVTKSPLASKPGQASRRTWNSHK